MENFVANIGDPESNRIRYGDPEVLFDIVATLGDSQFCDEMGSAYKAINIHPYKTCNAKIVTLNIMSLDDDDEIICNEIKYLSSLHSPFIVNYIESYVKDDYIWIVTDYCGAGSIKDIIRITNKPLNQAQVQAIVKECLKALKYLHSRNIPHQQIKASNIFLTEKAYNVNSLINGYIGRINQCNPFYIPPEITGFIIAYYDISDISDGICKLKLAPVDYNTRSNTPTPPPYWHSPEMFGNGFQYPDKDLLMKSDIWSLGITCIEMITGKPPYCDKRPYQFMWAMMSNQISPALPTNEKYSDDFRNFVSMCLERDINNRATLNQLIEHKFMQSDCDINVISDLISELMPLIETIREKEKNIDQNKYDELNESFSGGTLVNDDSNSINDEKPWGNGANSDSISDNQSDDEWPSTGTMVMEYSNDNL